MSQVLIMFTRPTLIRHEKQIACQDGSNVFLRMNERVQMGKFADLFVIVNYPLNYDYNVGGKTFSTLSLIIL